MKRQNVALLGFLLAVFFNQSPLLAQNSTDIGPRCQSVVSDPPAGTPIVAGLVATVKGVFEHTGVAGYSAHVVRIDTGQVVGGPVPIVNDGATITVTATPNVLYELKVTDLLTVGGPCQFKYAELFLIPHCLGVTYSQVEPAQPTTVTIRVSGSTTASVVLASNKQLVAGPAPVENGFARIVFTPVVGERYLIKAQNADATSFGCAFTYVAVFRAYLPLVTS